MRGIKIIKEIIYSHKKKLRQNAETEALDKDWATRTCGKKSFVMICHDKNIDRRIISEALSLQNRGWVGIVVALSNDQDDHLEIEDGVTLHRIGLKHVVPECPAYFYSIFLLKTLIMLPGSGLFRPAANFLYKVAYATLRLWFYHSIHGSPLPFDNAFHCASKHYRASLIQAHDLPALKAAATLAGQWGVPLVYDAHEFYPEQIVFTQRQKNIMFSVEQKYINSCDAVFVVNNSIGKMMANKYKIAQPTELTNAINPPVILNSNANLFRKEFNIDEKAPVLLFQGGFSPNRNLTNLVRAMALIKHPRAVLILMGKGDYEKKLRHIAEQEVPEGRIIFKDAVPQSELLSWTCSADIGIIPYPAVDINTKYCTPNKLFEFIQAKLPILANDLPELRRFVLDTGFGSVASMNTPAEIAEGIDSVLSSPGKIADAKEMLQKDRIKYTWDMQAEKYTAIIESIINADS